MPQIPSHLLPLHQSKQTNYSQVDRDRSFYQMENDYIIPVAQDTAWFDQWAKRISKQLNITSMKHQIELLFGELCEQWSMTEMFQQKIDLRYTKTKAKGYHSFYSSEKRAIFINEFHLRQSKQGKPASIKKLIYTVVHEFAHALADMRFSIDSHCQLYLDTLLDVLARCTGLEKSALLSGEVAKNIWVDGQEVSRPMGFFEQSLYFDRVNPLNADETLVRECVSDALLENVVLDSVVKADASLQDTKGYSRLLDGISAMKPRFSAKLIVKGDLLPTLRVSARKTAEGYEIICILEKAYMERAQAMYIEHLNYLYGNGIN